MVEDRGEAKARAALQTEKASLTKAADRLAKLVREFAEGVNYEPGFQYGSIEEHERDVSVEPARRPLPNGSINDYHSATISENHDRMVVEAENHVPVKLREISISDAGDI
jgi:hypothetical protein